MIIKYIKIGLLTIFALILILTLPVLLFALYYHCTHQYTIQIISPQVEQWEGWKLRYNLEELKKDFPEFLPFVSDDDSLLKIKHKTIGAGNTIFWHDGDGVYSFDKIYEKKRIENYFFSPMGALEMPQPYLTLDNRNGFLSHKLGKDIKKGTYYINKLFLRYTKTPQYKNYILEGFFIQIEKEGWRIAGYDMCEREIVLEEKSHKQSCIEFQGNMSPLLAFGEYKINKRKDPKGRLPELIIKVTKDSN